MRAKYPMVNEPACPKCGMVKCCNFCGKSSREVRHIVSSERGALICDECIGIANEIIASEVKP